MNAQDGNAVVLYGDKGGSIALANSFLTALWRDRARKTTARLLAACSQPIEDDAVFDFIEDMALQCAEDSAEFCRQLIDLIPVMTTPGALSIWRACTDRAPVVSAQTIPLAPPPLPLTLEEPLNEANDREFIEGGADMGPAVDTADAFVPFLRTRAATVAASMRDTVGSAAAAPQRRAREQSAGNRDAVAETEAIQRFRDSKAHAAPQPVERGELPIAAARASLAERLGRPGVLVVEAPTGSGKSTQIPQYAMGVVPGLVLVTQPRRIAAVALAARVASELGEPVGRTVGYKVRFDEEHSAATRVLFVTDGILLRMLVAAPTLPGVGLLMIDEAHQRSLTSDVCLGLARLLLESGARPDLRVVVASATIDAARFAAFFAPAVAAAPAVVSVPGRAFPVATEYADSPADYVLAAAQCAARIHAEAGTAPGDILVFLPGAAEIDDAVRITRGLCGGRTLAEAVADPALSLAPERVALAAGDTQEGRAGALRALVLPVYASLPADDQRRIFDATPPDARKIVVATNIAETSLTIDGVTHVVDCGFTRVKVYDARTGTDSLVTVPVSRQEADQRAGRAGRTAPGTCHRLYPRATYEHELRAAPVPEIQRANLAGVVLSLKALGIEDIERLPLLDPPAQVALRAALTRLYLMDALTDSGTLSPLGAQLAQLPVQPELALMLVQGCRLGVGFPVCVVAAVMTSAASPFFFPHDQQEQALNARAAFADSTGDHVTMYNVYAAWMRHRSSPGWARAHFVHERTLRHASSVLAQLWDILLRMQLVDAEEWQEEPGQLDSLQRACLCRAVVRGFVLNAAVRSRAADSAAGMITLFDQQPALIHPQSALAEARPDCVVFSELFVTTAQYLRGVTRARRAWLTEAAPRLYRGVEAVTDTRAAQSESLNPLFARKDDDSWRPSNVFKETRRVARRKR